MFSVVVNPAGDPVVKRSPRVIRNLLVLPAIWKAGLLAGVVLSTMSVSARTEPRMGAGATAFSATSVVIFQFNSFCAALLVNVLAPAAGS